MNDNADCRTAPATPGLLKSTEVYFFLNLGYTKKIQSVIMIIAGKRGGGSAGGDHPLLRFFSILQAYLFGSIKPQNKLCINLEVSISYYLTDPV